MKDDYKKKGVSSQMVQYNIHTSQHGHEEESLDKGKEEGSLDWMDTLISLRVELRIYKEDNVNIVRSVDKQEEVNEVILQSLSDMQRQILHELGANYKFKQISLILGR